MNEPTRIERILQKLGIEYERRGKRLWALCPFHSDHKPSWMIRPDGDRAGQHHCFVCHRGGGLVDLVMQKRGYASFTSAREWLKDFEEAPAPPINTVSFQVLSPIKKQFKMPAEVRFGSLETWPSLARRYAEQRGFAFQVERWRLGYAVEGRLTGRIVIPVWKGAPYMNPETWEAVSYFARTFVGHELPYYFPRESDAPNLDYLFGQCHFPVPGIRVRSRVYVTEGAINALACERVLPRPPDRGAAGSYVAALGSSDVRDAHLSVLATFGQVVIVTDNDKAGDDAAELIRYSLARHTQVDRVKFPLKQDPASVSPEICRRILATAAPR